MRAPALQALGPRRGRVAVPLALAGVVLVGWAGTLRPGTAMQGHAAHHAGLAAPVARWAARAGAMVGPAGAGGAGGLAGGLRASVSSIACCGLLMLVPFATGVMSVSWMAALTLLLVIERELPRASRIGAVAGVLLLVFAAWKLVA